MTSSADTDAGRAGRPGGGAGAAGAPPAPGFVRAAEPADAPALGAVQAAAWTASYAALLPAGALARLADDATAAWAAAITQPPSRAHLVLVAVAGAGPAAPVTGFAAVAPDGDGTGSGGDTGSGQGTGDGAELVALLVHPEHQRAGHGSRLLAAAAQLLAAQGRSVLRTWVPDRDDPRAALLHAAGWRPDGSARTLEPAAGQGGPVRERRWHTALGAGRLGS